MLCSVQIKYDKILVPAQFDMARDHLNEVGTHIYQSLIPEQNQVRLLR